MTDEDVRAEGSAGAVRRVRMSHLMTNGVASGLSAHA